MALSRSAFCWWEFSPFGQPILPAFGPPYRSLSRKGLLKVLSRGAKTSMPAWRKL